MDIDPTSIEPPDAAPLAASHLPPEPRVGPRLRRATSGAVIAGVCRGIGERLSISPQAVRVAFVVTAPTVIVPITYLAAALGVPDQNGHRILNSTRAALALMLGGLGVAMTQAILPEVRSGLLWRAIPWLLALAGYVMIRRGSTADDADAIVGLSRLQKCALASIVAVLAIWSFAEFLTPDLIVRGAPWVAAAIGASLIARDVRNRAVSDDHGGTAVETAETVSVDQPPAATSKQSQIRVDHGSPIRRARTQTSTHRPRVQRPYLGPISLCLTAIACVLMLVLGRPAGVVVAAGIIMLGAAIGVGAVRGRARGLVLPAAALIATAAPMLPNNVRVETLTASSSVMRATKDQPPPDLRVGYANVTIDLLNLDAAGDRKATYEVGAGRVTVLLPRTMTTRIVADSLPLAPDGSGGADYASVILFRPSIALARYPATFSNRDLDQATGLLADVMNDPRATSRQLSTAADLMESVFSYGHDAPNRQLGVPVSTMAQTNRMNLEIDPAADASIELQNRETNRSDSNRDAAAQPVADASSKHVLTLRLRGGATKFSIVEPVWHNTHELIPRGAVQSCIEAGGAAGLVLPCANVAAGRRVPTCLIAPDVEEFWVSTTPLRPRSLAVAYSVQDCRPLITKANERLILACSDGVRYTECTGRGIENESDVQITERMDPGPGTGDGMTTDPTDGSTTATVVPINSPSSTAISTPAPIVDTAGAPATAPTTSTTPTPSTPTTLPTLETAP